MKKTLAILIIVLSAYNININAQLKNQSVKPDTLLKLFQVMKPFDVFEKVKDKYNMDLKVLYFDASLKSYLMKWLDEDEYFQHKVRQQVLEISDNNSFIRNEIEYRLIKQKQKKDLDSILRDKNLYNRYKDSVISDNINLYIKTYSKSKIPIPYEVVRFHSFLAYPESYTIIKHWWEEKGKGTDRSNIYFMALVRMGDPEARNIYDNKISQFASTNGNSSELSEIFSEMHELNGSYKIIKMIELLKVDKIFNPFGDFGEEFKCFVLGDLINEITYNMIEIDKSIKQEDSCNLQMKHLPEIKAAAKKLIEKYKEEEHYWMKNMPFYKNEGK